MMPSIHLQSHNAITDVPGIKVGHATDKAALTGCTVILCEEGATAGVDVRGSAPGTRETDALRPINLIQKVNAILLTGGSAYGLDAAAGVMQFLEEKGHGYSTGPVIVPIVPAAVIFDLMVGESGVRPDKRMGYLACLNASNRKIEEGNVGAGTGATVGKILGMRFCMKSGVGTASAESDPQKGVVIGAIVVVNAMGDVTDPNTGQIVAGARNHESGEFVDTVKRMTCLESSSKPDITNTTIGVIATNARMNKNEATKVAQMAHDGLARVIRPVHTMADGDTIFAISCGEKTIDTNVIGTAAAEIMAMAVLRAVKTARSADGIPGLASE